MKILDRYLVRETLPPFLMALGMFTFLLAVKPMLPQAQTLLAKGVDLPTVGFLLLLLLPQALGVTIPMAFLAGVLMGLGRLSGDREAVAILACGISPGRLLRPILFLALLAGAADLYLLVRLVPDGNQRFREETTRLLARKGESDIKPGVVYEGFPGKVLYIKERRPDGTWGGVVLADTSQPGRPTLMLADSGHLEVDLARHQVAVVLPGAVARYVPGSEDAVYDTARDEDFRAAVSAESVFGSGDIMPTRGLTELTIGDLRRIEAEKRTQGISPHPEIIQRHQMFAFPVACLIFALVGVPLGLHTRKEGKLAGFTQGIAVIALYYTVMITTQNLTKGGSFPAEWARWVPNLVVGAVGLLLMRWRSRAIGRDLLVSRPSWLPLPRRRTLAVPEVRPTPPQRRSTGGMRLVAWQWTGRRLRLLDLYVGRRYLSVATLTFFGLLALYYIGTFIDKSERLFKGQATGAMLVEYFYYSTPQFIAYVVPMATLVAALATIGGLTRTSELTVMRACGISLYRTALPILLLSLLWSGGLFLLDDRVIAASNRRAQALEDTIRGHLPAAHASVTPARWIVGQDGRIFYYTSFDTKAQVLHGLSVFQPTATTVGLASHTVASQARFEDGLWRAEDGWTQRFPSPGQARRDPFRTTSLTLPTPQTFAEPSGRAAEDMSFMELRQQIAGWRASGISVAESEMRLYGRLAFPLAAVVMTLLGVPFGATTGRRGTLYGVGLAIILGAVYWLINTVFVAAGDADLIPTFLAAWAANLLFLALALYATFTVRT